tara:strand:- start:1805 stop:1999 length:195 start_codon:yes stop_codon:yes gene_type:complete
METETLSLTKLKAEIKSVHGFRRDAILSTQHNAVTNIDRNYRKYCKSDSDFRDLKNWAWEYYNV